MEIAYVAIDPSFPHRLNSFDNIPINYSSGALLNISSYSSSTIQTYTNVINFTEQSTGLEYNYFRTPYSRNKIILFLTTLDLEVTGLNAADFNISSEILSSSEYSVMVELGVNVKIEKLHFS